MQGFRLDAQSCGTLLLLACVLLSSSADAAYTMNETCEYYPNGYIGDPSNCQAWGYCQKGVLVATGTCNKGFLYDMGTGTCGYQDEVTCQTTAADICLNMATAQIIADPTNCQSYCYCNNKVVDCTYCPMNQVYNPNINECVWGNTYKNKCSADSICRLVPNNKFVADPEICGNYYFCGSGELVSKSCPDGYLFNPNTANCDKSYTCTGNGAGVNGGYPDNPTACSVFATPGQTTQFIADGKTCFGYYSCISTTGPGTWNKCPFGTHFNPTAQECVTPYSFDCTKDRCGNLNLEFVDDWGCQTYTYCQAQTTYKSGYSCPSGYPYFDEVSQKCITDDPGYPICSATATGAPATQG